MGGGGLQHPAHRAAGLPRTCNPVESGALCAGLRAVSGHGVRKAGSAAHRAHTGVRHGAEVVLAVF